MTYEFGTPELWRPLAREGELLLPVAFGPEVESDGTRRAIFTVEVTW